MPKQYKESKTTQELDTIVDNLTNELLDSDLNYIIDKIQKWQRHILRLKLAYKKRADNKKKREAQIKEKKILEEKIKEEQMKLMGLSEEERKREIKLAKGRRQVKEADEEINNILGLSEVKQVYSSEYNDTDDWIDFFIEKESHHF